MFVLMKKGKRITIRTFFIIIFSYYYSIGLITLLIIYLCQMITKPVHIVDDFYFFLIEYIIPINCKP